jgi:hypothetical protein
MKNPVGFMASKKGEAFLTSRQLQYWVDIGNTFFTSSIYEQVR